ncbi:MAG: DUF2860 family protein [Desulfobacterales bacterium]|nr:DUF2860 family protein [Desulfobacterales bacterium]
MRNFKSIPMILFVLLVSSSIAFAAGPAEKAEGFSGRISAGAGYMTSTDQLKTSDENNRIDSLSGDADWYDSFLPLVLFNLQYTFAESGRQIYFGTPPELSGPPGLSLGFVQPFSDGSRLDISVFARLFSEVWRDPYLTDVNRKETREHNYGTRVAYEKILGSGFNLSYAFSRTDVNVDDIGDRFNDLERDGYAHKAEVEYDFRLGQTITLTPGFELTVADIDGEANAYNGYQFGLGFRKFSKTYQLMLKGSVGWDDYDERHPVFSKTRNDTNYSVFGMFTRSDLFGVDALFATIMAGYRYRDSNIGFLNAQTFLSGAMVGIEF